MIANNNVEETLKQIHQEIAPDWHIEVFSPGFDYGKYVYLNYDLTVHCHDFEFVVAPNQFNRRHWVSDVSEYGDPLQTEELDKKLCGLKAAVEIARKLDEIYGEKA